MSVDRDRITDWALHPGGRGILDKLEDTLGLPPEALRESRDVLATRGNMSSVTVLHVLRQVIDAAPADEARTVCALAFGPGLTVESALFTIPARAAAPAAELDPAAAVPIR